MNPRYEKLQELIDCGDVVQVTPPKYVKKGTIKRWSLINAKGIEYEGERLRNLVGYKAADFSNLFEKIVA